MRIFCVSKLKFVDEPLLGCGECSSCYECPLAYVKPNNDLVQYIGLTERKQAELRQISFLEIDRPVAV